MSDSWYKIRATRDQNKYEGGLIEYVRKGVICKRIQKFETFTHDSLCYELTIARKKWLCFSTYQPLTPEHVASFFEELTDCLSKGSKSYENFIILCDFNIDVKVAGSEFDKLGEFCHLINLKNLIKYDA